MLENPDLGYTASKALNLEPDTQAHLFKICRDSIDRKNFLSKSLALKNCSFSIISNDCWGGDVYQNFSIQYQTPFVGTRIINKCYLRLLKNLKWHLKLPLEFSNFSRYKYVNLELQDRPFVIGILNGDIEIHFYHETNEKKVLDSWERRLERINWDRIFVKFSDFFEEDFSPYLKEFESLEFSNKICFTAKPYSDFPSAFFIPEVDDEYRSFLITERHFDIVSWLNNIHGSEANDYRIKSND